MRCMLVVVLAAMVHVCSGQAIKAEDCANDYVTRVAANGECLAIDAVGETAERNTLIVMVHGDGGGDYYHRVARIYGSKGVIAVAMTRPGYCGRKGCSSGTRPGYKSSYSSWVVETVTEGIKALKVHYNAEHTIVIGRSGGSAILGVAIGKYAPLADVAVLTACPCNVSYWRRKRGRGVWSGSLSPDNYTDDVPKTMKVITITGSLDKNTFPELGEDYAAELRDEGVDARFILVNAGHGVSSTGEFNDLMRELLEGRSFGALPKAPEPTAEEKAQVYLKKVTENFDLALFRFKSAAICEGRDGKDAARIADDLMTEYRGKRDTDKGFAMTILKDGLDKFITVGEMAGQMDCTEFAADQYRRVGRTVRRLDLPEYKAKAEAGLKALGVK